MEKKLDEVSPPGWSGTVKAMKRHGDEIDNPFALAWSMKKKGDKPHYKPEPKDSSKSDKKPEKKEKYKDEDKPKKFKEWLLERNAQLELPVAEPVKQLDTNQPPQAVVQQYVAAFHRRLENNPSNAEIQQMIDANVKKLAYQYGPQAGEFFRNQAMGTLQRYQQYQSAMANKSQVP